jgi:ubiquinone/menaquinone biosynthesis C-methylase UbiE
VVDVGCGTGRFTQALQQQGARTVGVDLDPDMLAVAAQRAAGPWLVADAARLPLRDHAVDVAVAVTLLEFVADPAQVLAELARVTRPGGRLVVAALNRTSPWGLAHRRRLRRPPWRHARLLTRRRLLALGRAHGRARLHAALFAPAAFPCLGRVGRLLEAAGRPLPALGAFQVLVVDRR